MIRCNDVSDIPVFINRRIAIVIFQVVVKSKWWIYRCIFHPFSTGPFLWYGLWKRAQTKGLAWHGGVPANEGSLNKQKKGDRAEHVVCLVSLMSDAGVVKYMLALRTMLKFSSHTDWMNASSSTTEDEKTNSWDGWPLFEANKWGIIEISIKLRLLFLFDSIGNGSHEPRKMGLK